MILLIQSSAGLLAQESLSITLEDDGQKFWSKLRFDEMEARIWYESQEPFFGEEMRGALGLEYGELTLGPLSFSSPSTLAEKRVNNPYFKTFSELLGTQRQWKDQSSTTMGLLYQGAWGGWAFLNGSTDSFSLDAGFLSPTKEGWIWGWGIRGEWQDAEGQPSQQKDNWLREEDWDQVLWGGLGYRGDWLEWYLIYHHLLMPEALMRGQVPLWGLASLGGEWDPQGPWSLGVLFWCASPDLLWSPLEILPLAGVSGSLSFEGDGFALVLQGSGSRSRDTWRLLLDQYTWELEANAQPWSFLQLGFAARGEKEQPIRVGGADLPDQWGLELATEAVIRLDDWEWGMSWEGGLFPESTSMEHEYQINLGWQGEEWAWAIDYTLTHEPSFRALIQGDPRALPNCLGELHVECPLPLAREAILWEQIEVRLGLRWERKD
jgi:hypothetical protein